MATEWLVRVIWVVVEVGTNRFIATFRRRYSAKEYIQQQPYPWHYEIIRSEFR